MSPDPNSPAALADALVGRAGWVCPTCIARSITVRAGPHGLAIEIVHAPRCSTAAIFVTDPVPPLAPPDGGLPR